MIFNTHSDLEGKHAVLAASKYSWLGYTDDQLWKAYVNSFSSDIGTLIHSYAKDKIVYRQKMEDNQSEKNALMLHLLKNKIPHSVIPLDMIFYNLMAYVNDAIGFKMTPELVLYYSPFIFGTADSISYARGVLRIHDLKTGTMPAKMEQLMIYAALFYLEYKSRVPFNKSRTELRIYQNQEVIVHTPTSDEISAIMEKIIHSDGVIDKNLVEV